MQGFALFYKKQLVYNFFHKKGKGYQYWRDVLPIIWKEERNDSARKLEWQSAEFSRRM